ncbi:MarR family transcriptional regulator [Exilibacterium tricleocarpae]|uniref:MarR family transcriptional regulator n=1 Tax=Exilibacterium tricleocarpae TaxID=2591008 RepID=A0A545TNV1_9GAMM|nr:helix-turn-helix domain-containing protein [Exilibacterium tricleocarpae]TQV78868.1 MarR family transcriptional regulator [Exilibacterium tricleocarpae]
MSEQETLRQIGLHDREIDIYLALLRLGPASIRDIGEKAGVNRGTTHELLKRLLKRGLVSLRPKGKRRHFCAESPEKLLELAREQQARLARAADRLESEVIPDLHLLKPDGSDTQVKYYEGDEGIEYVLRDILNTAAGSAERSYSVYSSKVIRKYLYRPFPTFTQQRVKRQIRVRAIAIGEGGDEAPLAERKWIATGADPDQPSYVAIYPPKCAMISLQEGDYPSAVVIESQAIARALQIAFDMLWKLL